jgi:hypothetical protein
MTLNEHLSDSWVGHISLNEFNRKTSDQPPLQLQTYRAFEEIQCDVSCLVPR